MSNFNFDDFARVALHVARRNDGAVLTPEQVDGIIAYLKTPGSGTDAASSFAEYVAEMQREHPAVLIARDYVLCSGIDDRGTTNYQTAAIYIRNVGGSAGVINDTLWGYFIEYLQNIEPQHAKFRAMAEGLRTFMRAQGSRPFNNNYEATLRDIMWNSGSPEFAENGRIAHSGTRGE